MVTLQLFDIELRRLNWPCLLNIYLFQFRHHLSLVFLLFLLFEYDFVLAVMLDLKVRLIYVIDLFGWMVVRAARRPTDNTINTTTNFRATFRRGQDRWQYCYMDVLATCRIADQNVSFLRLFVQAPATTFLSLRCLAPAKTLLLGHKRSLLLLAH